MSMTCSVPSGALTKFTGRNQLSVDATISLSLSIRVATNVAPFGVSSRRWTRLPAGLARNACPRNFAG
jgi:hypothetical protein